MLERQADSQKVCSLPKEINRQFGSWSRPAVLPMEAKNRKKPPFVQIKVKVRDLEGTLNHFP